MAIVACGICQKSFNVKLSHQKLGWGKYCSNDCRSQAQLLGKFFDCYICKKQIYRSISKIKHSKSGNFFCSKTCQTLWRNTYYSEEKHPNWINGIRSYRNKLLKSNAEQFCLCCNSTDFRVLIAHHIDHNRENNNISNLVWMCLNCHHLIHNYSEFEKKFKEKLKK